MAIVSNESNNNNKNIRDLRARIASGEITTTGSRATKVGEGNFVCILSDATYGRGESGNARGMITAKVLSGGTDAEVGGEFRVYLQTVNPTYAERDIALWSTLLTDSGVSEDKIFDDAEDIGDIVSNICSILAKMAAKQKALKVKIRRKQQTKLDINGKPRFWNDVLGLVTGEVQMQAGPVSAGQFQVIASLAAPEVPVVVPVPNKAQKPW
jgi:hypothetical protein